MNMMLTKLLTAAQGFVAFEQQVTDDGTILDKMQKNNVPLSFT